MTMGFFESGGGGFSNHFPTPDYQKSAVANYLKFLAKENPASLKHFNTKGVRILCFCTTFEIPDAYP
jgi:tripeptidyl-peptidase-1